MSAQKYQQCEKTKTVLATVFCVLEFLFYNSENLL